MDTINNMAASAAKAVWGENKPSTEEPVSGRYGDTTKGEPYDAGNLGMLNSLPSLRDVIDSFPSNLYTTEPTSATTGNEASTTGLTNDHFNGDATEDAKFVKNTGTATEGHDTADNPSSDLKAKSGPSDSSKGQGDTRSPEEPLTNPKSAPTDVNDTPEEGINEAQDLDGPGPKPLREVAKEKGGDAGNDSASSINNTNNKKDTKEIGEEEKKTEGTGEKYVQSSGLQADGGDFDATNPGAGREADRLMEVKGIHNATAPGSTPDNTTDAGDSGSPTSGKRSFGQKIKDKLHRH
ncbi:hypothetical protein E0Z10_g10021 [Xylaria hypoxylon]|uniref:Glycine-rich cell wall structural protein 1 n=1 Tax=Xylaria hypoxylon TaxID=37992 RepID=A0A4Z0YJ87_9PEZI|nr:hypothetical protein E0Z10_g10021 [Xylaria hypoxylon]